MRDSDALIILNDRDYEMIKLSFEKYSSKLAIDQFGYDKALIMKCHSYRRYN